MPRFHIVGCGKGADTMANRYYQRTGEILKQEGQDRWSIYNPERRGWEETERAKEAYETAFQDPFHQISGEQALKATAERQQRYNQWKEQYKRDNPEKFRRYFPTD